MKSLCVYPGSFDPLTLGHEDLIRRAAALFDRVIVAVLINPDKRGCFPLPERLEMIRLALADLPNVEVDSFEGLLVDYMHLKGARVVLRGLRSALDFETECQMAQINRQISPDKAETLFLATAPEYGHISSSMVRQVAQFGGDISGLVPPALVQRVTQALKPNQ